VSTAERETAHSRPETREQRQQQQYVPPSYIYHISNMDMEEHQAAAEFKH
jgi:hypothetical protein